MINWADCIFVGIVLLVSLSTILIYNKLVRLRALVRESFSGITVQLRRRADLIPNLVEIVKGYAAYERRVFDDVATARAATSSAGDVKSTAAADTMMSNILGRLFAVAEAYPELKASANFMQLSEQLADVESELEAARNYYNATVRDLNSEVQSFPQSLVAGLGGFAPELFYQDEDPAIQSAPKISMAMPAA